MKDTKNKEKVTTEKKTRKIDIKGIFKKIGSFFASIFVVLKKVFIAIKKVVIKYKVIVLIILALLAILSAIIGIKNYLYNRENAPYTEKMRIYGFDKMYDNGKATPSETVTKSEAIKMIIASVYNIYDISNIAYETTDTYDNALWVKYALVSDIINESNINSNNENDRVTYAEVIEWYVKARIKLLKIDLSTESKATFSDLATYESGLQSYINDAVVNELIENSNKNINANRTIDKGILNKLVVKFVEKYNTITIGDEKININPEKIPSNANIYPYTLASVDKSIYEKPLISIEGYDEIDPIQTYINKKEYYAQIKSIAEEYYNVILNVNYETIDKDTFKNAVQQYSIYILEDSEIERYINYVKDNKIKISGKATTFMPVVYYDGIDYRVRMKLDFKIESSNTKENILFKDLSLVSPVTYNDENSMLIDTKMSYVYNCDSLFIYVDQVSDLLTKE